MIPDEIKKYRPKGTEIFEKKGHYYVYKVKGYYDKETKKSKRKTLGCIGQIYKGIGFVANEKKEEQEYVTKIYGSVQLVVSETKEIFQELINVFGQEGIRIYVVSILKLLYNPHQKNMGISYEKSYLSEIFKGVSLSKNTMNVFLERLGFQRNKIIEFFRYISNGVNDNIIFDGTSILSNCKGSTYTEYGYNPTNPGKMQIRSIYAFNREKHLPVYYKVVPGNINDKFIFMELIAEMNIDGSTIILDKGFFSIKNIQGIVNDIHANFIIPLSINDTEIKKIELDQFIEENRAKYFIYKKRVIYYKQVDYTKIKGTNLYIYYDYSRRKELIENYYVQNNLPAELNEEQTERVYQETKYFGVSFLLCSKNQGAKDVYLDYKTRWQIEEMFDTNKNTLSLNMTYETKDKILEGWSFINYLASLYYFKLDCLLKEKKLDTKYSVKDIFLRAEAITKCKINDNWITCNLTKKLVDLFEALDVHL